MNRLIALIIHYGTPLVWLNVFVEQMGLPVPAVPTLVVAGALARDGKMSAAAVLTGSIIASVVADWLWFILGRRLGYRVLRIMCRISLSPDSCVRDTEARFERWGLPSLLFAKFVPGFATIAPPLAGASDHSTVAFLLYDSAGALLWAASAVTAGYIFHGAVDRLLAALESLGYWSVVVVVCALVIVMVVKWFQRFRFLQRWRLARISPQELLDLVEKEPEPVILDVRSPTARRNDPRQIPRALAIPNSELVQQLAAIPRDRDIILYCT